MYILTFLLVLFDVINGFSQQSENNPECKVLTMDQFQELEAYAKIIKQLETEDRINTIDAAHIKMLSSHSFVAFEQTPDSIVIQHGKISKNDIVLTLMVMQNEPDFVIMITSHSGFYHAFKYCLSTNILERCTNQGSVILLASEKLKFKHADDYTIVFYAENPYAKMSDWIKYYHLDLHENTFTHKKNCILNKDEEDCKEIEHLGMNKYIMYDEKK